MKTKLKTLIKKGCFTYVDSDITVENFPAPKSLRTDYKLFHFDRFISSEDAVKEMNKEGYEPANLYELLSWPDWNDEDWTVALGSVAKAHGNRCVPGLDVVGDGRSLGLSFWDYDWLARFRFLAVRNSSRPLETKSFDLGRLDPWTIGQLDAIEEIIKSIRNHAK